MKLLGHLSISFWLCAVGAIVLYVFFMVVAAVSPAQVAGVTAVMGLLAMLFTIRNLRVNGELADPGGNPHLRRARNRQRERRGF